MGLQNWRGTSQKEYSFATYPIILPMDLASIARFYLGRPIIYAFIGQKSASQAIPLYFGASEDGYSRLFVENHGATTAAMAAECIGVHIMQAPIDAGKRDQMVEDIVSANPTPLNIAHTSVFNVAGLRKFSTRAA